MAERKKKNAIDHVNEVPEGTPFRQGQEAAVAGNAMMSKPEDELVKQLREESAVIIVKQFFVNAKCGTADELAAFLDEALGVNGWGMKYEPLGTYALQCRLILRIGGIWTEKAGIAYPGSDGDGSQRTAEVAEKSFLAAAKMFGLGRAAKEKTPIEKPVAAAANEVAKPEPVPEKTKPEPAKPAKPQADAQIAAYESTKAAWDIHIGTCNEPDDLNKLLRGSAWADTPKQFKQNISAYIIDKVKSIGWEWDKNTKSFYQPAPPADDGDFTDPIPF